jgi:hypothetical protein
METMSRRGQLSYVALFFLVGLAMPSSPAEAQLRSCAGCFPDGEPCTLEYGASGVVRDSATGLPIAGALIDVLGLTTESASDGSYAVRGTRQETCHLDYYWSLSVSAEGYEPAELAYYATDTLSENLELPLDPIVPATGFTIHGIVAEFPACTGRMRGVTVTLEPLALTAETSVGPDGGVFEFVDVPPGEYVLRVSPRCNPFGCWRPTRIQVVDSFVRVDVCMDELTPAVPPTPTQTRTPTVPICPERTPCVLGDKPREQGCTPDGCGLGCGCEPCPACSSGEVLAPRFNVCECVPNDVTDPTPRPTPTGTPCPVQTPPICTAGQESICTAEGDCLPLCECRPCAACPEGMEHAASSCACIVTLEEDDPAPEAKTSSSSSGSCAIDPQAPSGSAALLVGLPMLLLVFRHSRSLRPLRAPARSYARAMAAS